MPPTVIYDEFVLLYLGVTISFSTLGGLIFHWTRFIKNYTPGVVPV